MHNFGYPEKSWIHTEKKFQFELNLLVFVAKDFVEKLTNFVFDISLRSI